MGTKKKRIQVYVNDATYGQIEGYAQEQGVSISEAAGQLLSTQVVGAASVDSQYVTRRQMQRALELLEARLSTICEMALAQQADLFGSATQFALERLAESDKELARLGGKTPKKTRRS